MLKGYMHGYFMEMKLYSKLRAVSKPFEYEEHRKKKIREKIDEKRQSRIIAQKRLPKVNKELAEKMLKGANKNKEAGEVVDDRFASLFKREEFEVDKEAEDFRLRNPTLATKRGGADDSDDDLGGMYNAVEEGDESSGDDDDDDDDDSEGFDSQYEEDGGEEDDSDLEIYNPDDQQLMDKRAEKRQKTKATAKNVTKEIKRLKKGKRGDDEEEEGDIITASKKAASKEKQKNSSTKKGFYEISDQFSSSKSAGPMAVMVNDDAAKAIRRKEKKQGNVPLSDRVHEQKKSGSSNQRVFKGSSGYTRELSYTPAADKKDKKDSNKKRRGSSD